MSYEIVLTDTAKAHYRALDARARALIKDGMINHLGHEPMKASTLSAGFSAILAFRRWLCDLGRKPASGR